MEVQLLLRDGTRQPRAGDGGHRGRRHAQVTSLVMFSVELSEKRPVAVNCWAGPTAMLGLAGVTSIDWEDGGGVLSLAIHPSVLP